MHVEATKITKTVTARDEVEAFKRNLLAERLALVTPKQRELFDRCYPNGVPSDRLESAIDLCTRTIEKNNRPTSG